MKRISILICFLCVATASLFAQPNYDEPVEYEIGGISVVGAEFSDPNSVVIVSGLSVGDKVRIPGTEISDAIKRIWRQNIYSDIQIETDNIAGDKLFLLITVAERPRIARFAFKGVTNSQGNDLREKITIIRGTIWNDEKKTRADRIIRNFFVEKGFYNCKVNITTEPDDFMQNGVVVRIGVDKGRKIKIDDIRINGNQEFAENRLVRKMKELKEKKFWRIWARSKYLPKKMSEVKGNLVSFYNENGYRDMRITRDTVYDYNEKSVVVEFDITEGQQYYFRNVEWSGNYKYSADTLNMLLNIKPGDVYNKTRLDSRLNGDPNGQDIGSLYLDDGYLFFNVQPVEVLVEADSIDLELRVYEGPQATIRKIIIEGNTKTSDYVVLRELRTLPGAKFSRSDLIRSQREILNLGFFNQETMNVQPIPDPANGTVDIKYIVEEKPSDQLQVQGGWGGRIVDPNTGVTVGGGFVGTVNLAFNNFSTKRFFKKGAWNPVPSGDGQKLSLAIQMNGIGWQNYSISFLEPWLGGKKPNSLGASVSYSINRAAQIDFAMKTFGSSLDFGKRMRFPDDFFRSYTTMGYKFYDITNGGSMFPGTNLQNAFINIVTLKQTFDRTNIDAPLFPRSGSQMTFSVEATPPYSVFQPNRDFTNIEDSDKYRLLEYHKWSFSSSWFFQVFKNLVIRPRIQVGYLGTYSKDYGVSPFERYRMGGSGFGNFSFLGQEFISLRGYPDNSVGASESVASTGGNIFNKYSLELRYPITLTEAAPMWVVGFVEAGNAWNGFKNYRPYDLKRSAGAGIRIVIPMVGLLGVDFGYGFDQQQSGVNKFQTHFIIGQEF